MSAATTEMTAVPRVRRFGFTDENARTEWRQLGYAIAVVVGLHLLPRLVLGTRSYVTVHDNLETDLLYRVLIARDHRLFSYGVIVPELLGGLPRWDYPSALKVSSLLFGLLPAFWAYVVLEAFVRAVAVLGMGLLLRDYIPARRMHRLAIAATFGILPFYSIYDLSVAGEPLVAWALLNLWHERRSRASLAICAAFPFASVLWTGPPFFFALAGMVIALAAIRQRRLPLRVPAGLLAVAFGYAISDQQYLGGLLRAEFVSHRSEWHTSNAPYGISELVRSTRWLFVQGRFHAASLHTPILLATILLALLLFVRGFRREARLLSLIVVAAGLLALSTRVPYLRMLDPFFERMPALRQINVRFWWTLPLFWYATLAVLSVHWSKTGLRSRSLNCLLAFQFLWVFATPRWRRDMAEPELRTNYVAMALALVGKKQPKVINYEQFVSARAFDQIRRHIGADTGRFLTIGMHVASAAFNGFPCADGLHDNYPLAYKKRFRRLIAKELRYNLRNREYFDGWGGRAYVLLRDFALSDYDEPQARPPRVLRRLDLDEAALHDLGVKWIVSALVLKGPALADYLTDEGSYGRPRAGYVIRLYRVRDPRPGSANSARAR